MVKDLDEELLRQTNADVLVMFINTLSKAKTSNAWFTNHHETRSYTLAKFNFMTNTYLDILAQFRVCWIKTVLSKIYLMDKKQD
jgi:hypothetical protein